MNTQDDTQDWMQPVELKAVIAGETYYTTLKLNDLGAVSATELCRALTDLCVMFAEGDTFQITSPY